MGMRKLTLRMGALRTLETIMNLVPLDRSFYDLFFAGVSDGFWGTTLKKCPTLKSIRERRAGEGRRTGALAAKTRNLLRDTLKTAGERL